MRIVWNRLRYTVWAPWSDALVAAAEFGHARRRSLEGLEPPSRRSRASHRSGTGWISSTCRAVSITAVDITPAMLERCRRRAGRLRIPSTRVTDAGLLAFEDGTFDAVVLHLVLAVMLEPERGLRETERVLKPGGRAAIFAKFLGDVEQAPAVSVWSAERRRVHGHPLCERPWRLGGEVLDRRIDR
jgi:phosphatidylethanolamine/phosphatidyl-N-methylethanolamine N-methyltransferase